MEVAKANPYTATMLDDDHVRDPNRVRAWKRALLAKGSDVAALLGQILSGKEVELDAGIPQLGAGDKELRLRRFLELIDRGIKRAEGDRFGRCAVCGVALPQAVLDEQPWTDRCAAHPAS
jgi:hypothetical protein